MVEDTTHCDLSPAQMQGKGTAEDFNDSFGPIQLKAVTQPDEYLLRNDGEPGLNELEGEDIVNSGGHLKVLVDNKDSDQNVVKDILVDEGVPSQNKNDLESEDDYKLPDPAQARVSDNPPEISSKTLPYQDDANDSLDFGSLLDQVEVGSIMTGSSLDDIVDKSYLDELLASANNPFLEDVETCREVEREAVDVAHPYNPFLDNESFKAAKDASDEGMKISVEVAKFSEEKKTVCDDKAEAANVTLAVDSGTQGANDKMKVPEHTDTPANAAKLQLDPFESSFATTNPYPTMISYSGQIPFSGSISHRSESSATSNRSFAFPVLQTECITSPVRMAKANRKHNSWRHSLLCCNF